MVTQGDVLSTAEPLKKIISRIFKSKSDCKLVPCVVCCPTQTALVPSEGRENKMGYFSFIIFQGYFVSSDELSGPGSEKSSNGGGKKEHFS